MKSAYQRLTKRAEFLAAARGRRWNGRDFTVQIRRREVRDDAPPRFGVTVTKKVGIAVIRNRVRRRLREALRRAAPAAGVPGHDYVLIARAGALKAPFERLVTDLTQALSHADRPPAGAHGKR